MRSGSARATSVGAVPARLRPLPADEFAAVRARLTSGHADSSDLGAVTRHLLALLVARAPGTSVEVRVPPFAAVQCIAGARHTRGTPPAVVETDPRTWIALATGELSWQQAVREGRVHASGERSDLTPLLPLV